VPGRPGYSAAGRLAGETSVLFSPPAEPFATALGAWANAPYHQVEILNPRLVRTGFSLGCMNTTRGIRPAVPAGGPPRLLAWPGDGARGVPRSLDACEEAPDDPFTDAGWSCGRSGAALYLYALAARCTGSPSVVLTPRVPLRIVPAGACTWIAVTGVPLPPAVRMEVRLAGVTLRSAFTTT
jgi:hypothetical protein